MKDFTMCFLKMSLTWNMPKNLMKMMIIRTWFLLPLLRRKPIDCGRCCCPDSPTHCLCVDWLVGKFLKLSLNFILKIIDLYSSDYRWFSHGKGLHFIEKWNLITSPFFYLLPMSIFIKFLEIWMTIKSIWCPLQVQISSW